MNRTARVVAACGGVLVLGVLSLVVLALSKRPPPRVEPSESAIHVEAIAVQPENVPVVITGYGPVRALDVVAITPEVAGTVVDIHPRLEVGEIIAKGETLFVIDPRTYEARVDDGRATIAQLEGSLERLRIQYRTDKHRLENLERTRDLARAEHDRSAALFEQDDVGAKAGVERAEQAYNTAQDMVDRLAQALEMYPVQIEETKNGLAAARARLAQLTINLERTRVVAPFDARVKTQRVEKGQYVAPGVPVLTLADDSVLEITVPLDSREASQWLQFAPTSPDTEVKTAWFAALEPVECTVRWTEDRDRQWIAQTHRVAKFDEQTRTVHVALRVDAAHALSVTGDPMPLLEGMFCEVEIPGRVMASVYRVPRSAVDFTGAVYVANDNRLRTVAVDLTHEQAGAAFVSSGLNPGDLVIVTRLVNPLENCLLEVDNVGRATVAEDQGLRRAGAEEAAS